MRAEPVIRQAARPLISRLVPPLELEDLYQVGRLALWERGEGKPAALQVTIARRAMIDELRRCRWACRSAYADGHFQMANYNQWEDQHPLSEGLFGVTDCHAASLVAVRQCIARIAELSDRQRKVLECLASGMDQTETAHTVGVTPSGISRIVAGLRERIERELA